MLLCVDLLPVKCMKSKFLCDIFPLFNHPLIYQGNALSITISQYSLVNFCYCMQTDVTAQGDVMVLWTHENPKIYYWSSNSLIFILPLDTRVQQQPDMDHRPHRRDNELCPRQSLELHFTRSRRQPTSSPWYRQCPTDWPHLHCHQGERGLPQRGSGKLLF